MNSIVPISRRTPTGAFALVVAAVLVGSVVLAMRAPSAIEDMTNSAPGTAARAAQQPFDPHFVYFPSQYELHVGPPEEHIEAF